MSGVSVLFHIVRMRVITEADVGTWIFGCQQLFEVM
jgi:hypothetical protein